MSGQFDRDIAAVQGVEIVPTILETLCGLTGMGFAAIARVTEDRWIACDVYDTIDFGLKPGGELKIETTICDAIRDSREPVVIDDASIDPVYIDHPTPRLYKFTSYISVPVMLPDGRFFGTLCAIDPRPARVSRPEIVNTFTMFARLIAMHLDAFDQLGRSEAKLVDEQNTAQLREQFIAVLGHDLRNPLASVASGVSLLQDQPQSARATTILTMMRNSTDRMAALIDNVLDFARGRLGGGLSLDRHVVAIEPLLAQVIGELQSSHPDSLIDSECTVALAVNCDPRRIGQLVSNLVGNAITHGAPDTPIVVVCGIHDDAFRLTVTNAGLPIRDDARARLFQPFERGSEGSHRDGLGLGLYIASKIAEAHGGRLGVSSTAEQTCFTFEMPLGR